MQTDQLNGLIALKLVAEKRNFRAAAEALSVSPSAISQTIKQLESKLGVALLTRTTRSTGLTEAGERFLNEAGPALEQILTAMDSIGTYGEKPSGLLRLNLPKVVYRSFLPPLIEGFIKKHPEVSVELYFEDGQADIVKAGFDAGIRVSDILEKDMVAVKLFGPIHWAIAGAPKYFAKMGHPKHPKDLLSHHCLRSRLGANHLYDRWEFEHKGKAFQVHVKGPLIINDSTFLIHAAMDGAGIVYTTEDSIQEQLKSGKLERVLTQYSPSSAGYYLYYPRRSQVAPKLRAFIDYIKNAKIKPG